MSAFMMPENTTAIIATYLAMSATDKSRTGTYEGLKTITPPDRLIKVLHDAGCYDASYDEYDAAKIYAVLSNYNITALKERYGECSENYEPFVMPSIRIGEITRKEWLSNLFTVARCYHYQISEGMVCDTEFFKAFREWIDVMAYELAQFVVAEVRPRDQHKSWSEF